MELDEEIVSRVLSLEELSKIVVTAVSLNRDGLTEDCGFIHLQWCAKHRLISNSYVCKVCQKQMRLENEEESLDGFVWKCPSCEEIKSVRENSFFENSQVSLWKHVRFLYMWSLKLTAEVIYHELGLNSKTVAFWNNIVRHVCVRYCEDTRNPIGGLDADGNPKIVEIAESFFYKGSQRPERVFGAVERGDPRNCFFVLVKDEDIIPIVNEFVSPRSIVCSDTSERFCGLGSIEGRHYRHLRVRHEGKGSFVDKANRQAHTQTFRSVWGTFTRGSHQVGGISRHHFESYLDEFVFRNHYPFPSTFGNLLFWISHYYPV